MAIIARLVLGLVGVFIASKIVNKTGAGAIMCVAPGIGRVAPRGDEGGARPRNSYLARG